MLTLGYVLTVKNIKQGITNMQNLLQKKISRKLPKNLSKEDAGNVTSWHKLMIKQNYVQIVLHQVPKFLTKKKILVKDAEDRNM